MRQEGVCCVVWRGAVCCGVVCCGVVWCGAHAQGCAGRSRVGDSSGDAHPAGRVGPVGAWTLVLVLLAARHQLAVGRAPASTPPLDNTRPACLSRVHPELSPARLRHACLCVVGVSGRMSSGRSFTAHPPPHSLNTVCDTMRAWSSILPPRHTLCFTLTTDVTSRRHSTSSNITMTTGRGTFRVPSSTARSTRSRG
jgi:hypothetical protein